MASRPKRKAVGMGRRRTDLVEPKKCPKCETDDIVKPDIVMKINVCGHSICNECVINLFRGGQGQCPVDGCGIYVKQNNYRLRTFQNEIMDKEIDIRKNIEKIYNRQLDDFDSEMDYNDYLELIEDIIDVLTHETDQIKVAEKRKEIKLYEQENLQKIRKSNQVIHRRRREWEHKINTEKQREKDIAQKFKEQDRAKVTSKVDKEEADLIEKIAKEARQEGYDVQEVIRAHQEKVEREKLEQQKLKEEQDKVEAEQNAEAGKRGNIRNMLKSRYNANAANEPQEDQSWYWQYEPLHLQKTNCPELKTRDTVLEYISYIPVGDALRTWSQGSFDLVSIAQRQINDAMSCL